MRLENLYAQYQDYIYVFLSTENQVINFIPLATWQFKEVFCLTVKGQENEKWDKRIKDLLIAKGISISETILLENIDRKNVFEQIKQYVFEKDKVFWNITGGQRPLLLAIFDFIYQNNREDDVLAYVEGNSGKIACYKGTQGETISQEIDLRGKITMEEVLNLRGFKFYTHDNDAPKGFEELTSTENEFYLDLLDKYLSIEDIRNKMRDLNIKKDTELTNLLSELDKLVPNFINITEVLKKRTSLFGEIFERMAYAKIKHHFFDEVVDIKLGLRIDFLEKEMQLSGDENDVVLFTKNGLLRNFECKSGNVKKAIKDGDELKSHHYTTYIISGVYGRPFFISPILISENKSNLPVKFTNAVKIAEDAGLGTIYVDQLADEVKSIINQAK